MPFDSKGFMQSQFQPRTAAVDVPALAPWFGDDKPVWTVRGQTASEIARSMESVSRRKNVDNVVKALGSNKDQIDEIKRALGMSDDTPDDIVKRISQLTSCSVDPVCDEQMAVRLAETYPVEFYSLTNKIIELTGLGVDVKKLKTSGQTAASEA